jgi:hypothetical protein
LKITEAKRGDNVSQTGKPTHLDQATKQHPKNIKPAIKNTTTLFFTNLWPTVL